MRILLFIISVLIAPRRANKMSLSESRKLEVDLAFSMTS
jgi:hypothetical protein